MTFAILAFVVLAVMIGIAFVLKAKASAVPPVSPTMLTTAGRKATGVLSGKPPLTEREQSMFFRIAEAVPDDVVLAQVAFSALVQTKDRPTRATFDRKVADFVVCTKSFAVLAVIELDDSSHKGREAADEARESLLTEAGYRVLRYRNIPDLAALAGDLAAIHSARATNASKA